MLWVVCLFVVSFCSVVVVLCLFFNLFILVTITIVVVRLGGWWWCFVSRLLVVLLVFGFVFLMFGVWVCGWVVGIYGFDWLFLFLLGF